jgi:uncharacterized protein YbbC (DUF1343 family)
MSEYIKHLYPLFVWILLLSSCSTSHSQQIKTAAERSEQYLGDLKGKRVGLITNQSGRVGEEHLVDFLLRNEINLIKIFAPEHGFRGDKSDGVAIKDEMDPVTGIPVVSLYGSNKKPSDAILKDIEVLLFDLQEVGLRYYTYLPTMSLAMEAAAENDIPFIVLDRPNPNGFYIDGPILDTAYRSIVGAFPIPIVSGMTIGELAFMIVGEKWINKSDALKLKVVSVENYTHDSLYQLPVAPSPNLPNMKSVYLYASLCLLEGANVSIGRGTDKPFQLMGYPGYEDGEIEFTPKSISGVSRYPKFENKVCQGIDLSLLSKAELTKNAQINWSYLWKMYAVLGEENFFKSLDFFQKLSGSDRVHQALKKGWTIEKFRASYHDEIEEFKVMREKYLLYK